MILAKVFPYSLAGICGLILSGAILFVQGSDPVIDRVDLERAMEKLPQGYRVTFVLAVIEQYSHEEIAGLLACSPSTSRSQLFKALNRLRALLA